MFFLFVSYVCMHVPRASGEKKKKKFLKCFCAIKLILVLIQNSTLQVDFGTGKWLRTEIEITYCHQTTISPCRPLKKTQSQSTRRWNHRVGSGKKRHWWGPGKKRDTPCPAVPDRFLLLLLLLHNPGPPDDLDVWETQQWSSVCSAPLLLVQKCIW